jgi:hypothetical protein
MPQKVFHSCVVLTQERRMADAKLDLLQGTLDGEAGQEKSQDKSLCCNKFVDATEA